MIPMGNGKVVGPFDRVRDVNVITAVAHPQAVKGLGNLAIFNKAAAAVLKKDTSVVKTDRSTTDTKTADNTNTDKGSDTTKTSDRAFSNELSNEDRMNGILLRKVDEATGAVYREYKNLDAVEVDYPADTAVYKKAAAYFAQDNHSDRVAVLDYVDGKWKTP